VAIDYIVDWRSIAFSESREHWRPLQLVDVIVRNVLCQESHSPYQKEHHMQYTSKQLNKGESRQSSAVFFAAEVVIIIIIC
jgi:hypothetical protein